ncbi:hypothetical protein BpHYR1_007424 [Brachionus plicatilis]|uniref:Uncharacterized protein n=1 Tax=Brachionus plicatilis TaxID=10195 RepID=A0A3M7SMG4_BRAPC|nr:hypothetical protein BpHYR1_007424 [Brachionus plicatilis]
MKFYENLLKKLRKFKISKKSSQILNFRLFFGRSTFYEIIVPLGSSERRTDRIKEIQIFTRKKSYVRQLLINGNFFCDEERSLDKLFCYLDFGLNNKLLRIKCYKNTIILFKTMKNEKQINRTKMMNF